MPRQTQEQIRSEILDAATHLFATVGYRGTSLADIAGAVGYSKSALLYHFATKGAILRELIAPGAADLAELDARTSRMNPRAAQRAAAEGFVELAVHYRDVLVVLWPAIPEVIGEPGFADIAAQAERLKSSLAGLRKTPQAQVTAIAVLSGVTSACSELRELTEDQLRAALLAFVRRALDLPTATRARRPTAPSGRPTPATSIG